jgi:hypothetical protein
MTNEIAWTVWIIGAVAGAVVSLLCAIVIVEGQKHWIPRAIPIVWLVWILPVAIRSLLMVIES